MSNQHIYLQRGRMRFMTAKAKKLKEERIAQVKKQWNRNPIDYNLGLDITYFHGDKRVRDIDNYAKIVLDCMNGVVFEDDGLITEMMIRKFYDKENPRVECDIFVVED